MTDESVMQKGKTPSESKLNKVREQVDMLFEEYETPSILNRSDIDVYIADWDRRIGYASYCTTIEEKVYGKRVTGRKTMVGHHAIGIAKRAFDAKDEWKDTVAHELAHITAYIKNDRKSAKHGQLWKEEARRLGAEPTRCGSISEENQRDYNYFVACPNLCYSWGKLKRSRTIQEPELYRCPDCETDLVSYEAGDDPPTEPGTCAVDCSDLS